MQRISVPDVQPFETEHIAAVRKAAPECMVLLKYDGSFPLSPCKLAAYGSGVRHTIKGGTGSGDVNVRAYTTVEQGLLAAGFELTSAAWLDAYDAVLGDAKTAFDEQQRKIAEKSGQRRSIFIAAMPEPEYIIPIEADGDTAIYVLSRNSGEGVDRQLVAGDIQLTETEVRDICTISAKYEKFMLVLNVGGMVDLTPVRDVQNILIMSQLGTPTGDALADVLCGKAYPSGKLTMTWAPIENYPSTLGFGAFNDTRYTEGVFVGYRYFDTFAAAHTYPFGYGLGYTTFAYNALSFRADEQAVTVTVEVRNTGKYAGKEVMQLYYSAPDGKLSKPAKELAAFAKTQELQSGESQTLTLSFSTEQMASYNAQQAAYILEPGVYDILLGTDADHVCSCGRIVLYDEVTTQQLYNVGGTPDFDDLKPTNAKQPLDAAGAVCLDKTKFVTMKVDYAAKPVEYQGIRGTWEDVKSGKLSLEAFVGGLSNEQLAYLCIGNYKDVAEGGNVLEVIGNASTHIAGAAGETTNRLTELGIPALTMPDGPAGLRLSTEYVVRNGNAVSLYSSFNPTHRKATEPGEQVYYQYCIAIPIGTALAQTWNLEVVRACGSLVGEEMEMFGTNLWLAPAMNIYRSPLCGRNFEYYSEDPLVTGLTAAAVTEGIQAHRGCAATIKHFCCNNQETNRRDSNSILSERALREIYLKGFEICVHKAHPHCVMSSYNLINGVHANNRRCLLTDVLRDEWGFEGFVMTDWLSTIDLPGPEPEYPIASAGGCIQAGNDMMMPGLPCDFEDIMDALANETHPYHLTRAQLQQDALRILKVIEKLA